MSTCETCRFWWPQDICASTPDYRPGICRRRSPQTGLPNSSNWPTTYTLEWCGEHEKKPSAEPVLLPEGFDPKPGAINRVPGPQGKPTDPEWWR